VSQQFEFKCKEIVTELKQTVISSFNDSYYTTRLLEIQLYKLIFLGNDF